MQVCAFIFPTELHLSCLLSRKNKASSGEDIQMSDFERSYTRVKPWIILFQVNPAKIPNLQQNVGGEIQSSTVQNGEEQKFNGSQEKVKHWITFVQVVLSKKRSFPP